MKAASKKVKNLSEEEILNSLENAISLYKTKDFEQVVKNSVKNSKSPKRAKAVVKNEDDFKVIKKSKKSKKSGKGIFSFLRIGKSNKKGKKEAVIEYVEEEVIPVKTKGRSKGSSKNGGLIGRSSKKIVGVMYNYRRQAVTLSLCLVMLSFISYSSYIAYAYMSSNNNDVVEKVSSHIILPTNESPKVYIIQSDKSEIFNNPLFKGIQIGDNVLSYPNSGKVIIYRSKEDKIVNVVNTAQ